MFRARKAALAVLCALMCLAAANADEYRIGPGDVLEINFWQDPDLNTVVRVSLDGSITLDIIGQIEAGGRTTQELQGDIVRRISRLNKNISQAVVRVSQYNFNHVYVTGEVRTPGKLAFEAIPDLWSIINEAGGATDAADLTRVTIIRGGEERGQVEIVNVSEAIADGTLHLLPKVRRKDTIELPTTPLGLPAGQLGRPLREQRSVIYVVGAVMQPGPIAFEENVDLLEAIALAGGPTPGADLKKAKIIRKDGYYAQTVQVDLDRYSRSGKPIRYLLDKEDTVVLPERRSGFFGSGLGTAVSILGAITSAVLIYDRLSED